MSLHQNIKIALEEEKIENNTKSINIQVDENIINILKNIVDSFNYINPSKGFSRTSIIEDAITNYIKEAKDILTNDYDIDIDNEEQMNSLKRDDAELNFNLVIFPAKDENFNKMFINGKSWYSVRISASKVSELKYIALYRTAPYSKITHFAKIKTIEPYEDTNKKIIYIEEPIKLSQEVCIGNTDANAMRAPRYTTLVKLKNAKQIKDLF